MRILWILLVAVSLAVALGSCASGGGPTPPVDDGNDDPVTGLLAGGGALNGYVSAAGEAPQVSHLRPTSAAAASATVLVDTGQVGFTNSSGAYWIPGVPVGERTLSISVPGSAARTIKVTVAKREITSGTIHPTSTTAGREGAVNGYVYATDSGAPELSAGQTVGLRPVEDAALSVETGQTARTDAEGFFHISDVPPGFRTLTIVTDTGTTTETVLVPAGRIASGTGQLPGDWGACRGYVGTPRAASLPQLVVAASGTEINPVAGALVRLSSGETALTKADGGYSFSGVASGNPSLSVGARDGLELTAGIIIASGAITEGLTPPSGFIRQVAVSAVGGSLQAPVGGALWLQASALDAASRPFTSFRDFTWLSRNTAIATVDANGVVTARQVGSVDIVASAGGVTGDATVTVAPLEEAGPHAIQVTAPSNVIAQGSSIQLTARALDGAGVVIPDASFAWTSTDSTVAPVTQDGVVGGAAVGSATILCSSGALTGSVALRVDREGRRVSVEPAYIAFGDGETTRTLRVWDGAPIAGSPLLWSITGPPAWLAASPCAGGTPALVDLRVSREDLPAGLYEAPVTIQATGGDAMVTVGMAVSQVRLVVDAATAPAGTATLRVQVTTGSATTAKEVPWPGGAAEVLVATPPGWATVVVTALDVDGHILGLGQAQAEVVRGAATDVPIGLA